MHSGPTLPTAARAARGHEYQRSATLASPSQGAFELFGVEVRRKGASAAPACSTTTLERRRKLFGMVIEEYFVKLGVETNSPMRLTAALPGTARPIWEDAVGIVRTRG